MAEGMPGGGAKGAGLGVEHAGLADGGKGVTEQDWGVSVVAIVDGGVGR